MKQVPSGTELARPFIRSALAHRPTARWRNTRLTHLAPQGLLPSYSRSTTRGDFPPYMAKAPNVLYWAG